MEMRLDLDGRQSAVFLRVPTLWDPVNEQWLCALKLPSGKLLMASGADSKELSENFNKVAQECFSAEANAEEFFAMFKPLEYWER